MKLKKFILPEKCPMGSLKVSSLHLRSKSDLAGPVKKPRPIVKFTEDVNLDNSSENCPILLVLPILE